MSRGWRTLNPRGHASRADRAARQDMAAHLSAYGRLGKEPEFQQLRDTLRAKPIDKERVNQLTDALNAKGFTDREIERAL